MNPYFIGPEPLCSFLSYCNESPLEKTVLDCGAGGTQPPLAMFKTQGFDTYGIDLSDSQLQKAQKYCLNNKIELGIIKGDMRNIPFDDASMSFIYAYSSICHMSKADVDIAISEISRVLKPDGLCFVSFCAAGDDIPNEIESRSVGEYPFEADGLVGVHSLYTVNETDLLFKHFKILRRVRRMVENFNEDDKYAWAEIYYIAQKL